MIEIEPGDQVRVAKKWATSGENLIGTVKRIFLSDRGGEWAAVRFDGQIGDQTFMTRELEVVNRREFADPGYRKDGLKRYPLNDEKVTRAAWVEVSKPEMEQFYSPSHLIEVRARVKSAMNHFGVELDEPRSSQRAVVASTGRRSSSAMW
jgi:hypothetical protein